MIYWELLVNFFRIGFFTIGGGYAMLPLIQQEIEAFGWITAEEFVDIVAIAEMTPGAIGVNAATFVGFRTAGILGSLVATTAITLPSLIIIVSLYRFWETHQDHPILVSVLSGIKPAVGGLIGGAAVFIGKAALLHDPLSEGIGGFAIDPRSLLIAVGVFIAVRRYRLDPIKAILASAVLGLALFRF